MAATTTPTTDSPRTTTASATNGLPSPWAQVVKGGTTTGDSPENTESTSSPNIPANDGNVAKKTAWNTAISPPLAPPVHPQPPGDHQAGVMGAASWPALSDSARLPLKSSVSPSLDSPKSSAEVSAPLSQGPVTSHLQQPKQGSGNASQNSSVNSAPPTRQRSMKRGGGGGGNRQGGFARGPPPPPLPVPEMAHTTFSKIDSTSREVRPSGGFASQSNPSNEHPNHRNSNRRGNFGQHGRGDVRNNYHGGRRDQDHGNNDWSSSNSHGRGAHGHHHRPHGRGFMGPPAQVAPPFAPPLPVRPYGNGYVYSDALVYYIPSLPSDSFRNGPYITGPPPPPYLFQPDPLRVSVINQIDYYFSDANLVKDGFLRSKMDEQGWVPITLIASFPRVKKLSDSVPFILDCLSASTVVEVQVDKIRRRDDWMKWISHQQSTSNPASGSQSPVGSYDNLTTAIEELSLEEKQDQDHTSAALKEKENDEKEITHNLRVTNLEGSVQRVC